MNIGKASNRFAITSKQRGDAAENAVAEQLQRNGFDIVTRNWRTRYYEIDIVAQRDETLFFVEVKYRVDEKAGTGLAYVTPAKVAQMCRASDAYCMEEQYQGARQLAAIEVTGEALEIGELIEIID